MARIARRVRVTGDVQGVFFRAWTKDEAQKLGVTGWARNAPIDMTPYRGETVDRVIECNDIGDSLYDTAVLVDKVELY